MAGTIIADYIRTDANKLSLNVGNTVVASINASGILSNTGSVIIAPDGAINANNITTGTFSTAQFANGSITVPKLGYSTVIQTVGNYSGAVTIATGTPTDIVSLSITTQKANSYIFVNFSGDCNANDNGAWKYVGIYVDGVQKTYSISSTTSASYQEVASQTAYIGPLTQGTHTVAIKSWQGSGSSTWSENGYHQLVVMEINS